MASLMSCLFVALVAVAYGARHEERMFMSRTTGSDQVPSASGYIYRSDGHGPASYVQLGSGLVHHQLNAANPRPLPYVHAGPAYVAAAPVKYYHAPAAFVPAAHLPANVAILQKNSYGAALPVKQVEEADDNDDDDEDNDNEADDEDVSDEVSDEDTVDVVSKPDYAADFEADTAGGYGSIGADSNYHGRSVGGHAFENGGGHEHGSDGHSAHGEKGEKGYKQASHFNKGEEGKYAKEGHKGHYSKGGGEKAGHSDTASHYNENHAASKGHKGGEFHEAKGHKKGSKTTGFHNVYHKDEFKKEQKFYDDAHNSGHFKKHGEQEAQHHGSHGEHVKAGKHDSAFHKDSYGKKGFAASGHVSAGDKGHVAKEGQEAYHNNHSDYGKKGGHSGGSESGYSKKY